MERAGQLSKEHGGGSMTFLGLADTLQGDLTGYIPSNLISICDGLVSLSSVLFGEGMRPAVDFSLSLSIVGGRAQPPILRELSSGLRRTYLEYAEVARLSKLQSGLSKEAEGVMKRGTSLIAMLQQPQAKPAGLADEILVLYALRMGILEDMEHADRIRFRDGIAAYALANDASLSDDIKAKPVLSPEMEKRMAGLIRGFFGMGS
jgi:F-type H+/Na+-transporting ATPase subunit alpha